MEPNLFQEIVKSLHQWPPIEQKVFMQAHYRGRSLEEISRSLHLDMQEVHAVLRNCERRLHASLRNFRGDDSRAEENLPGCLRPGADRIRIPA